MLATMQRKCSGGINSVLITKIIAKMNVPKNYFVIVSARMVVRMGSFLWRGEPQLHPHLGFFELGVLWL